MKEMDAGNAGLDVLAMRHRLLRALVAKGQVRAIDSSVSDETLHDAASSPHEQLFPKWWSELSSYGNRTYGYPYTGLTAYLCYRKDLIDDPANQKQFKARYHHELRPPATWQDYNQLAEFFNHRERNFCGTYIQGKHGLALWYEWLNYVYSFGGDILDTPHGWDYGDIVINSPQNIAATTQYIGEIKFSPPDTSSLAGMKLSLACSRVGSLWGFCGATRRPSWKIRRCRRSPGRLATV